MILRATVAGGFGAFGCSFNFHMQLSFKYFLDSSVWPGNDKTYLFKKLDSSGYRGGEEEAPEA
jgi:hypothetical protein